MPKAKSADVESLGGVSAAAVEKATGKNWKQWLAMLDKAGARKMDHKSIAKLLHEKHGLSGWWSQMVTVGYEQARGMREKHEKPSGFEIGVSKTINVPITKLYAAWSDKRRRTRWLPGQSLTIRKANKEKNLRITWPDETHVTAHFYNKAAGKSQITVQHGKLKNAKEAERAKKYWKDRLAELKTHLEA